MKAKGTPQKLELTGQRFGKWTVVRKTEEIGSFGQRSWWCRCDCGNEKAVSAGSLRNGMSRSCGCVKHTYKHGMEGTPTYGVWVRMLQRCENPNYPAFVYYGARGIKVCERWHDFLLFLEDMGQKPGSMSLGRLDNDGDYEPRNCKWETASEQVRNRRNSIRVNFRGELVAAADLAERYGLSHRHVAWRLRQGYSPEQAILPRHALRKIAWEARRKKQEG